MDGRIGVYFEAAAVIISLTLLGQMLELKARSQTSAAIIEDGGFIITGWPFLPNRLSLEDMTSEESVKTALMGSEIKYIIKESDFYVHKLR